MATGDEQERTYSEGLGSEDLSEVVCDPCQEDGELHKAVGMCVDCQDYLCQRCFDVHKVARPSRTHELLNNHQMLQSQVSLKMKDQCTEKCAVHEDEVIKYYCTTHEYLVCSVCITLDHRLCDKVTYIPHAAKDLVNNEEYQQAERQLKSVVERSKKLTDNYKHKTESLEIDCSEAVKMIQDYRRDLNKALDRVEEDLIQNCKTLKSEEIGKFEQIIDNCNTAQTDLHALLTKIENFQNNKQNCNLYTAMMRRKETIKFAAERMKEAENGQSLLNSQIILVTNKETLNTLNHAEVFGKLTLSGASIVLKPDETKPTDVQTEQITVAKEEETGTIVRAEYLQGIRVRSESDSKTCFVSGMVALSDRRRLVIADFCSMFFGNGNVKLVNVIHNKVTTHLTLSPTPWDVAKINNSQVVVTLPNNKNVGIVSVAASAMTVDNMLDVDGQCWGVDYKDGKLAVSFCKPDKVQVLTLQGGVLHTITADKRRKSLFNSPYYVIFGQDTTSLFVSNWGSHNVMHVDLDGTVIGIYTDRELSRPRGLLTDSSGNVYVCGEYSNNIHQITTDCRKIQVLLTRADELLQPLSISYNEADSRLYVGMFNNDVVKMYKVTLGTK